MPDYLPETLGFSLEIGGGGGEKILWVQTLAMFDVCDTRDEDIVVLDVLLREELYGLNPCEGEEW